MCAPIPLGMRRNSLHENPHSRAFSARRALTIKSRQTTILPPIPQNIPLNQAPQVEPSLALTVTGLPVTTPPITALSPDRSVSIPGLSVDPGVHTLSITSSATFSSVSTAISTLRVSSTYDTVTTITPEIIITSETTTTPETIITSETATTPETTIASETTITPETTTTPETTIASETPITSETTTTSGTTITSVSQTSDSTVATTSYTIPIVSSSTTNVVKNTVLSSPISFTPANLSAHNPSFYVAIVLGTVAGIACLCALIAWFIRCRRHVKCRHAARSLKLPWSKPVDDSWGLESSRDCPGSDSDVDTTAISAMHLGSREDLANVQAWSPRGDRDVGEPRRAENGDNGSTYSLKNHHIPEYCLFSDDSVRSFVSSEGYSTASLLPHHNLRQLPSHLIDQELVARVSRERASLRSNDNVDRMDFPIHTDRDCGTPRETMNKPRFLSLRGNGLSVPWHPNSSGTRSMVERLRNHHGKLAEPPWEQISPRQNLDEIDKDVEADSGTWSNSFKSSLVSAFNAVAANLSSAVGTPQMNGNGLTSAPSKRTAHKSVRDTFWDENVLKAKELSRETSVSTMTSSAWTLEETREGAGVVHLFIPGTQVCGDEPVIQRPHLSGPTLSFGDRDDIISDCDDNRPRMVEHPQVPLIASERPPPAVIRPDRYHARHNNTRILVNPSLSRAGSSNYSTMSMINIGAQTTSRSGSLSIPNPYNVNDSSDSIVEPTQISRLSSSDSSITSLDGTTGVIEALKERRNRVPEV